MKRLSTLGIIFAFSLLFSIQAIGQVEEVSEATGLPIPIGAPVIYGQVAIDGLPRDGRRPNIFVTLLINGVQAERRQTDNRGYFFFLENPRHGHSLLFEVDGSEVGRAYLTIGTGNRIRQDVSLDWRALKGASMTKSGVVPVNGYARSSDAEKIFDKGMAFIREGKNKEAADLFKGMVAKDPKDFLGWTMLGSIYDNEKKYPEAISAYEKAMELKPEFLLARINRGKVAISQNKIDQAIEILTRALELDQNSADANHALGEAYLQAKKGSLAVGFLNKAIQLAPLAKAEIHLRLAALYNGANLKDRAAAEYKAFLEKVPNHPDKKKYEQYVKDNLPK
ncbi:MAG: tetratricopeptide repeat protein [Pyrinomonadaceae bacterium]